MEEYKILYNITYKVDKDIVQDWISWMRTKQIPDIMKTHCFEKSRMNRLLYVDEEDGITFTVQYLCPNIKALHYFHANHAMEFENRLHELYKEKYVAFQSVMEVHDEF